MQVPCGLHPPAAPARACPQNRVRWLKSLGLENAEVARLVQAAPDLLALPPVVSAPVFEERMQLLGLAPAALHSFVLQRPEAVPLLLKSRLNGGDIRELRRWGGAGWCLVRGWLELCVLGGGCVARQQALLTTEVGPFPAQPAPRAGPPWRFMLTGTSPLCLILTAW